LLRFWFKPFTRTKRHQIPEANHAKQSFIGHTEAEEYREIMVKNMQKLFQQGRAKLAIFRRAQERLLVACEHRRMHYSAGSSPEGQPAGCALRA
jgi:hypothetical protein